MGWMVRDLDNRSDPGAKCVDHTYWMMAEAYVLLYLCHLNLIGKNVFPIMKLDELSIFITSGMGSIAYIELIFQIKIITLPQISVIFQSEISSFKSVIEGRYQVREHI